MRWWSARFEVFQKPNNETSMKSTNAWNSALADVSAGTFNAEILTTSPATLISLRKANSMTISARMICATVIIRVLILAAFGRHLLNLKEILRKKDGAKETNSLLP